MHFRCSAHFFFKRLCELWIKNRKVAWILNKNTCSFSFSWFLQLLLSLLASLIIQPNKAEGIGPPNRFSFVSLVGLPCGKNVRYHPRTHTGEKPFNCKHYCTTFSQAVKDSHQCETFQISLMWEGLQQSPKHTNENPQPHRRVTLQLFLL